MKRTFLAISAATLILGTSHAALAEEAASETEKATPWYVEGGYHHIRGETATAYDIEVGVAATTVGYRWDRGWGVEAMLGQGIYEGELTVLGENVTISTGTVFAIAGTLGGPIGEDWGWQMKIRYTQMDIEGEVLGYSFEVNENPGETGYGVGVYRNLTDRAYISAEVNQFYDGGLSAYAGLGWRF